MRASAIEQYGVALVAPGGLVGESERVQLGGCSRGIVDPLAEQFAPADQIYRKTLAFEFIREPRQSAQSAAEFALL